MSISRSRGGISNQMLEPEEDVNLMTLAPNTIRKTKARDKLRETNWDAGEVKIGVSIRELKFCNKKVPAAEIITLHRGEKKTIGVPFNKKLEFAFTKVEDEMIFKFAVTSHGDLLGFIYLEIPQKFRTMKEFRLDDWFPVKQVEVDEEEVIKMQNFVARIIINYKADRKLQIKELFTGSIPREKMYKMLAKNLRDRLGKINQDVENFQDDGFKYLGDLEKKLLEKRGEFSTRKRTVGGGYKGKDLLSTQKQTFYKGNPNGTKAKKGMKATSKVAEVFHKDDGKDVIVKGGEFERQAEELLRELTKTKKDLVDKNQRIRSLQEGKKDVDNDGLRKKLESLRRDLLRDKKELAIKLKENAKAMALEKRDLEEQHEREMNECQDMKDEINDVMGEYQEKYRQLERLEDEMKDKEDTVKKNGKEFVSKLGQLEKDLVDMEAEKKALDELEDELDQLKERMLLERQKIYKESEEFSYNKGDITTKDKQLDLQEENMNRTRAALEKEREETFENIEKKKKELLAQKEAADTGSGGFRARKEELDSSIKDLMQEQKKIKAEAVKLLEGQKEVDKEQLDYENLKKIADEEKEQDLKTLENDYEYVEEQMGEIDKKRKEMDDLQTQLGEFESMLKEQEASTKMETVRFNKDRENFYDKVDKSEFNKEELKKLAKAHGMDMKVSNQAMLLQEKREAELNRKKTKVRGSIVGLGQVNKTGDMEERKKKINDRRSTMVNRLSVTGQNLGALRMEHKFDNKKTVQKFLAKMFEDANAIKASDLRDKTKAELEDAIAQLTLAEEKLEKCQADLQQSKLNFFLKRPKKRTQVIKKRMSMRPKDKSKRASFKPIPVDEYKKQQEAKQNQTETITKTITRQDSQGNEITETITETVTTTKEAMPGLGDPLTAIGEGEDSGFCEEDEDEMSMEEFEEDYVEFEEEEHEFDPDVLPKDMIALQDDLFKRCDNVISVMEAAKPGIEHPNKIDQKVKFLNGGKNCLANIFKVINILNNDPDSLDNAVIREMEAENADLDFDSIKFKYEENIKALVAYIRRIRSNYNFFNQGIDQGLLVK